MSGASTKRQRTHPHYELLYHPGIPGRGEFIRLVLEASGVPYTDVANASKDGYSKVQQYCMDQSKEYTGDEAPVFSPPALRVPKAGKDGKDIVIHQTPSILLYLSERTGMVPEGDEEAKVYVNEVALTALDLNNEVHDTHHPLGNAKYYEDQKEAALSKAEDVRANRLPKFFSYFTRVLGYNEPQGGGKYLVGSALTYADTTVWQVLDGCFFAFPQEMKARKKEFPELLDVFYNSVKNEERLKEYLASKRRLPYGMGIFRHYPELDRQ